MFYMKFHCCFFFIIVQHYDLANQLGLVYTQLCEAGHPGSFNAVYEIRCNIDGEDNFEEIEYLIQKLNMSLVDWKKELDDHRSQFPLLNLFSNKQCLVIRKYLYPLIQSMKKLPSISSKVLTLLKFVNQNVNEKIIEHAFFGSYVREEDYSQAWQTATVEDGDKQSNFILLTKDEIKTKIEDLVETHDIDETVAKACFIHIVPFDIRKALSWCRKNIDNDDVYDDADYFDNEMENIYSPNE